MENKKISKTQNMKIKSSINDMDVKCVSALLFNKKGDKIIRVKSKDKWDDVGGKINNGESHQDALIREVKELL